MLLRDAKIRSILIQIVIIGGFLAFLALLGVSAATNLKARGIPIGLDFLWRPADFTISETVLAYSPRDPAWWAVVVGIANTLFISAIVLVLSSILGLVVGVGRLSDNPLVNGSCRVWVEIARNSPAIILLIFVYALWWKILPQVQQAWTLAPGVYLSVRGLVMPSVSFGLSSWTWLLTPAFVGLLYGARVLAAQRQAATGMRPAYVPLTAAAGILMIAGLFWLLGATPTVDWPERRRANFFGGIELTPELTTILLGLTFYTAGFIAEIIRGGILAIPKGQWEAAKAVGLHQRQILRLIIIPQALRIILPPLTSQYINVIKNSTLAIAVGYQDFMTVVGTLINKSSHAIEGILIILGVFLIINLALSALLNWFNGRMAIVER